MVGAGDFDGDSKSDILWRHTGGDVAIWFMNGAALTSGVDLGPVNLAWQVASTGDYDGDGKADIIWRHTGGDAAIWLMDGIIARPGSAIAPITTTWGIVE